MFASATIALLASDARAQGVAFQPVVGVLPNGPALNVTPAVSIDRRYVRLGVNPQFIAVEGFNTYLVPAAVGTGPGGPGAVGGGQFLAGMNGVIGPVTEADFMNMPRGEGLSADAGTARGALPGFGGTPAGPRFHRASPPRAGTIKALRSGRNLRQKTKHPDAARSGAGNPGK
jgi:hypothetical protein